MLSKMSMQKDLLEFVKLAKLQMFKGNGARNVNMNNFKLQICFSQKNILFCNIIIYIIIILYCSVDCKNIFVQRITETSNVFFSNLYFLN